MEKEQNMLYRKFQTTGQERIKLACALEGFFSEEEDQKEQKADYREYLKRRIRPAMEKLIKEEDTAGIELLEAQGWFGEKELELFIRIARQERSLESLVWLMKLKDYKYGYTEKKFEF